jgi:putative ABC transport system substrate-binding protein
VFVAIADPVGGGFADSLARPGGNATGFMAYEWSISGKWLELLKQIAPSVKRAAVLRDPSSAAASGMLGGIQSVASSLRVELRLIDTRDIGETERAVVAFAREPNGGQIVFSSASTLLHRNLIAAVSARQNL